MNIPEIIRQMTLEEKAGLCSGADFWHTKAIERLGVPQIMVSDGPHGLRKQDLEGDHLGVNDSIQAVCFPAGCATAASFDRQLVEKMGQALGEECQAENVAVLLGPAVNIKRSPLCGRNFEYYSEDPYVAGQTAASFIKGVQSKNVGVSIKHFYANNQEHRRMSSSSVMDERTKREIYLAAFEQAIQEAKPWTVMCSYNRINGVYAAQDKTALTEFLRDECQFDGFVMSDWGAVDDRAADLAAGMDLEMPSSEGVRDREIVRAVQEGRLPEAAVDLAVERILTIVDRYWQNQNPHANFDRDADHELSREIASQCMVLLKNEDHVLPLSKEKKTAFIGAFAEAPRFQGGGSSHIHCHKVESALEMAKDYPVIYAKGYDVSDHTVQQDLYEEAIRAAKSAETAVIFAGLPDALESEGYDRTHMRLPDCQNALISAVAKANPNTVVVLHNGSPVEMPWIDEVKGVLETYLCGQAVGGATVQVLYGDVNPSGHLAETFPRKLEDNPSYLFYPGEGDQTVYAEGVFVGYRYYATKKMPVLFPFGHGLSYTTFQISDLKTDKAAYADGETVRVTVHVTNTGDRAGKQVVQLYVLPQTKTDAVLRPVLELRGYEKVSLMPGETKTVSFELNRRAFAYYHTALQEWIVLDGDYAIAAGGSSAELETQQVIHIAGRKSLLTDITLNTTVGDILALKGAREILRPLMESYGRTMGDSASDSLGESTASMMEAQMKYMPLRGMISFGDGKITTDSCLAMVEELKKLL